MNNLPENLEWQTRRREVLEQIVELLTANADILGPRPEDPSDFESAEAFVGPMICTGVVVGAMWCDMGAIDDPESPTSPEWVVSTRSNGLSRAAARGISLDLVDAFG